MAAPWYLLSAGAVVLIIGFIMAVVRRSSADQTYIDPRMTDDEIAERLQRSKGDLLTKLVLLAGFLMMAVSLAWRLALRIASVL